MPNLAMVLPDPPVRGIYFADVDVRRMEPRKKLMGASWAQWAIKGGRGPLGPHGGEAVPAASGDPPAEGPPPDSALAPLHRPSRRLVAYRDRAPEVCCDP